MVSEDNKKRMETAVNEQSDFWVRSAWIWSFIFYAGFFVPLAMSLLDEQLSTQDKVFAFGLVLLVSIWHWAWVIWYRLKLERAGETSFRAQPWRMSVYLIGMLLIWIALVQIDQSFFMALFGMYSQFYFLLNVGYAIAGSLLLTLGWMFVSAQLEGTTLTWQNPVLWIVLIGTIFGGMFAYWISGIIEQSVERRSILAELQATQAELAASERRAGVLAERQRLAQEIHDTLAQGFISIIMNLETAVTHLPDNPEITKPITQAQQTARDNLAQARHVVQDLRPEPLEKAALPDAIQQVAHKWQQESGVETAVTTTGDAYPLPPDAEVTLLRATQEALANIRKHANADDVQITLSYMADMIILDVQDNGIGLANGNNITNERTGGYGLTAMRERVAQFNGSVLLESEPDEGTTLVVTIPVIGEQ